MGRKRRQWYAGCTMHVMGRGIRRSAIYGDSSDYKIFMQILERTQKMMPFQLHSFCLMTNHFHLLLTTQEKEIWHIMKRVMCNYAKYFNQKYDFTGHLFDSRYTSSVVQDWGYFLEVSRYIHLNPVKAGIVRKAGDYPYSSYEAYVSEKEISCLTKEKILDFFQGNKAEEYRIFVEGPVSHLEQERMIQKEVGEDDNWLP